MKIPSISLRSRSCCCQPPGRGAAEELRRVKCKRVGPGLSPRRKAVRALSAASLPPVPGGFPAQVDGPRAVCIHYLTGTGWGRQGEGPFLSAAVSMLGIICKVRRR